MAPAVASVIIQHFYAFFVTPTNQNMTYFSNAGQK